MFVKIVGLEARAVARWGIKETNLLMIGVLAKLAGQDSSRAMAHWAQWRTHELSQLFDLKREKMPHSSIWSRVLGHAVEPAEVEAILGRFCVTAARESEPQRGSLSAWTI